MVGLQRPSVTVVVAWIHQETGAFEEGRTAVQTFLGARDTGGVTAGGIVGTFVGEPGNC
jgi:hypothetical protein